ncbi:hypothetical protein [Hymenobacter sp. B81]|uniref:hypothetical protein n=1 Tax=Hymenobacter sp. B81 TaxID=3344878 RepID=UPI0037DC8E02
MLARLLTALALLGLVACQKESASPPVAGCRDPASVNYNAQATTDNGSCRYPADLVAGLYQFRDTMVFTAWTGGGPQTQYLQGSFVVTKTGATTVNIANFDECATSQPASVSQTSFVVTASSSCRSLSSFLGAVQGQGARLRYSYSFADGGGSGTVRGTATKMP